VLEHRFRWKKMSIACAIGYRPGSRRTRLCFQIVADSYNERKLIEFLQKLRRHFCGQRVVLIWDGLPSHRSGIMSAYVAEQRSWLEVVQLPGYAPELNPVEDLWANIKGQELANRCVEELGQMLRGVHDGFRRIRGRRALLRSFLQHSGLSLP
jgi:transposase